LDGGLSTAPGAAITNYSWTTISGPAGSTITNPNSASTVVSNLLQGSYTFRLTVTNNSGASASDDVIVTVNAAPIITPPSTPPVSNAGDDVVLTIPNTTAYLNGNRSTAPGGTITTYNWSKVSGPTQYKIVSPDAPSTYINSLVQGSYVFRLTIKDNNGATAVDDLMITVNGELVVTPPVPPVSTTQPVAKAGNDVTLTVPNTTAFINGTGSTAATGTTITSYNWSKVSGPAQYNIVSPDASTSYLNSLVVGSYTFRLTVKDNKGGMATDDLVLVVNGDQLTPPDPLPQPPAQGSPLARAGSDFTVLLPNSAVLDGSSSAAASGFTLTSYNWTKVAGPGQFKLVSPSSASTYINGLVFGVYTFRLLVTDNKGATSFDDIIVTVTDGQTIPTEPLPPVPGINPPLARAGADVSVLLPYSVLLDGNNSSSSGSIKSFIWTKVSGPTQYNLVSPANATTFLNNLTLGVYIFRLTITDDKGLSSSDDIMVTVNSGTSNKESKEALSNINIDKSVMTGKSISIYPNPVLNSVNFRWTSAYKGIAAINIIDGSGAVVKKLPVKKELIQHTGSIDVSSLKQGVFMLQIQMQDGKSVATKFIKD
jgi:hypothetical protein